MHEIENNGVFVVKVMKTEQKSVSRYVASFRSKKKHRVCADRVTDYFQGLNWTGLKSETDSIGTNHSWLSIISDDW